MKPSAPARPSPGSPSEVDLLRHIAREEPLTDTVRAFRGLTPTLPYPDQTSIITKS